MAMLVIPKNSISRLKIQGLKSTTSGSVCTREIVHRTAMRISTYSKMSIYADGNSIYTLLNCIQRYLKFLVRLLVHLFGLKSFRENMYSDVKKGA
jgi:hypothetical protein